MSEYVAACDARAMHVGSYSSWLTKVKGDSAKAKWLSSATKRYFTIDYSSQMFYYSHAEDKKTISQPIHFKDILSAEQLPRPAQANKHSSEHTFGFAVRTCDRTFELFTGSYADAQHWVDGLNAARDIVMGLGSSPSDKAGLPTSDGEMSTTAEGSCDSGHSTERYQRPPADAPWLTYGTPGVFRHPTSLAAAPAAPAGYAGAYQAAPVQAAPVAVAAPGPAETGQSVDPFAALDALEEMAGPPPEPDPLFAFPQQGTASKGELLSHARLLVTNPDAARKHEDPRRRPAPPAPPAEAAMHAEYAAPAAPAFDAFASPAPAAPAAPASMMAMGAAPLAPAPPVALEPAPAPAPPAPAPAAVLAAPQAMQHVPVQHAAPAAAHGEDSDWDNDGEAAPVPGGPYGQQQYQQPAGPSGWDSDDEDTQGAPQQLAAAPMPPPAAPLLPAPAPAAPLTVDACGAPLPPPEAFVAAKPRTPAAGARGGDDDLDDLVGEMLQADTDTRVVGHGLVPDFHCTGCDFQVMRIDEFVWSADVDYMFFRNNYPTFEKLRKRLARQQGCSAFCCQCSWKSAHSNAELVDVAEGLRWRVVGA